MVKKMITKCVINIMTNEVIEEESQPYNGPWALCGGGGGGTDDDLMDQAGDLIEENFDLIGEKTEAYLGPGGFLEQKETFASEQATGALETTIGAAGTQARYGNVDIAKKQTEAQKGAGLAVSGTITEQMDEQRRRNEETYQATKATAEDTFAATSRENEIAQGEEIFNLKQDMEKQVNEAIMSYQSATGEAYNTEGIGTSVYSQEYVDWKASEAQNKRNKGVSYVETPFTGDMYEPFSQVDRQTGYEDVEDMMSQYFEDI